MKRFAELSEQEVLALAISIAASVALVAVYVAHGSVELQGIALALALGGLGAAIVIWAVALIATGVLTLAVSV